MRRLLILLSLLGLSVYAAAQCANTAYGTFTCVQTCEGHAFSGTSHTCVMPGNQTSGDAIVVVGASTGGGTLSVTGCGNTWTTDSTVTVGSSVVTQSTTTAASTGACTLTLTTSGSSG